MSNLFDLNSAYYFEELLQIEIYFEITIHAIRSILKEQGLVIDKMKSLLNETLESDEFLKNLEGEYKSSYINQIYVVEKSVIDEIKLHQLSSLCLLIYSVIEGRLKKICERLETVYPSKIKIKDLASKGDLDRYWKYLTKVFEIDISGVQRFYTPLNQQKTVRNILAHRGGEFNTNQEKDITLVEGLQILNFEDNCSYLSINENYIEFLLNKSSHFVDALLKAIDIRYKEIKQQNNS